MRTVLACLLFSTAAFAAKAPSKAQLEAHAKASYGSRAYAPLLALFDVGNAPPPPLEEGIEKLQLRQEIEGVVKHLASISLKLRGLEADLLALRPKKRGEKAQLPTPILMRLRNLQSSVSQGRSALVATGEKWEPPKDAIAQMDKVSKGVDALVAGELDPKGRDIEALHTALATAMVDTITWWRAVPKVVEKKPDPDQ